MILKVKHEELKKVKSVMKKDSELLDDEITTLINGIEKLRTIWQGQDADLFCNNVSNYFNKMKTIPVTMRTISEFIGKVDNKYVDNDDAFSRELKTEVNYDEPDSNKKFGTI